MTEFSLKEWDFIKLIFEDRVSTLGVRMNRLKDYPTENSASALKGLSEELSITLEIYSKLKDKTKEVKEKHGRVF